MDWDPNRSYNQHPVILDGGYKEFLERYPTEVSDDRSFLQRKNSEVDELLDIDEVCYPEIGSAIDSCSSSKRKLVNHPWSNCQSEGESPRIIKDAPPDKDKKASVNGRELAERFRLPVLDRLAKPVPKLLGEGFTGISNRRNNCYMNCMLQCLKCLPQFKSLFVTSNNYYSIVQKKEPGIILHFASVMRALWEGTARDPQIRYLESFFERVYQINPVYRKAHHEDTFEFFVFLFGLLHDDSSVDMPRAKVMTEREKSYHCQLQGRTSPFVDLFYYQTRNDRVCWNCHKRTIAFDCDNALMLALSEQEHTQRLEDLIGAYMKDNMMEDCSCSECKRSSVIVNRKTIAVDPEILVIVLKRYASSADGTLRKIDSDIVFPPDGLLFGRSRYRLYAIPRHSGSVSVGHYYASAIVNESRDVWVKFNDEEVTRCRCPITEAPDIRSSCVGFFYVRSSRV